MNRVRGQKGAVTFNNIEKARTENFSFTVELQAAGL